MCWACASLDPTYGSGGRYPGPPGKGRTRSRFGALLADGSYRSDRDDGWSHWLAAGQTILPRMAPISDCEKALSVWVRTLPRAPMLKASADAV